MYTLAHIFHQITNGIPDFPLISVNAQLPYDQCNMFQNTNMSMETYNSYIVL